jgi:type III pantothenate kinase
MTNLWVADVGSSFVKVARFDAADQRPLPEPLRVITASALDGSLEEIVEQATEPAPTWRVISVRRAGEERLAAWVRERFSQADYRVLSFADFRLRVNVDHPERVGVDRLAAAVAANALRDPARAAVVVDSGTAITVDLVDASGVFQGGAILPGVRLVSKTLHEHTDVLPEVVLHPSQTLPPACGRNTRAALESGLFWGVVGAVKELIRQLREQVDGESQVFLSGGDGKLIASVLRDDAEYVPHLALRGAALAGRKV